MYKITTYRGKQVSRPREILSLGYEKITIEASPLLTLLGFLKIPLLKGDTVKYWVDKDFNVCVSPEYTNYSPVFWAACIQADRTHTYLQLQNCLGFWGNLPYPLSRRYLWVEPHPLYNNTLKLSLMKEGTKLQRYMVFWDYTVLDIKCQLKIIMQVAKWHSSPKINITIKKESGIAEFASHATIHDIREFIDNEYLHGKVWFIEISDVKMANRYIPHVHCIVDPAMYYYTSMEMDTLIDKFTQ